MIYSIQYNMIPSRIIYAMPWANITIIMPLWQTYSCTNTLYPIPYTILCTLAPPFPTYLLNVMLQLYNRSANLIMKKLQLLERRPGFGAIIDTTHVWIVGPGLAPGPWWGSHAETIHMRCIKYQIFKWKEGSLLLLVQHDVACDCAAWWHCAWYNACGSFLHGCLLLTVAQLTVLDLL